MTAVYTRALTSFPGAVAVGVVVAVAAFLVLLPLLGQLIGSIGALAIGIFAARVLRR